MTGAANATAIKEIKDLRIRVPAQSFFVEPSLDQQPSCLKRVVDLSSRTPGSGSGASHGGRVNERDSGINTSCAAINGDEAR